MSLFLSAYFSQHREGWRHPYAPAPRHWAGESLAAYRAGQQDRRRNWPPCHELMSTVSDESHSSDSSITSRGASA